MTKEEALMTIQAIPESFWEKLSDAENEAIEMAVNALKGQMWIPCSERLPEDLDEYYPMCLVSLGNGDVCLGVYRYDNGKWWTRMSEGESEYSTVHEVLAWMPLPEAYKGE